MDRWAVIRQVAARVLAEFETKAQKPAFTQAQGSHALLSEIAACCFGLAVTPDPSLDERWIGHLDDYLGVTYWPGLSDERRNVTIAHEIGHKALDHPARPEPDLSEHIDELPAVSALQGISGVSLAYDSPDRYELEANVFAAELLAPIHHVRTMTQQRPDWTLEALARYFGLSKEAMANQLVAALLPGPQDAEPQSPTSEQPPLDDNQREAAEVNGCAALVIAGPGAGKTRVLTERYRYLVERCGANPRHILALTFSNKAAEEMRLRLEQLLPQHAHEIYVSTFHSLGLQLLTTYGRYIGLPHRVRIASDVDGFVLLRNRLSRLELGHFEDLGNPTRNLRILLEAIKKAKNELMGPQEYAQEVRAWRAEIEALPEPIHKDDIADRRRQIELIEKFEDVARAYQQYQLWLRGDGLVDYGDLLMESVQLFDSEPVSMDIRSRYRHILVDEFQDINYASGRLIRELDGGRNVAWAVGDPKQSIFRFQGASIRNLTTFRTDFPGGRIITLQNNYRSVGNIVAAGEAVTFPGGGVGASAQSQRQELFPATLVAIRGQNASSEASPPAVRLARTATPQDERAWIAGEIQALQQRAGMPLGSIAILCRRREQAQAMSDYLEGQGISTNWEGVLQNNPLFKDIAAVMGLAADDPKALVRLAGMSEHALCEADLRVLLQAAQKTKSLSHVLYRARDGEFPALTEEGRARATALLDLFFLLHRRPTPWSVVTAYLFELSRWPRAILCDDTPPGIRMRTTLGQIADLVRSFRDRGAVTDGHGAAAFLRYVALAIESGRLESAPSPTAASRLTDAVHILTMHGSKGLQWPVVFVPHLVEDTWKGREGDLPQPRFLPREKDPLDSEEAEDACLVYVAITRAQDRVLFSSAREGRFAGREVPLHPSVTSVRKSLEPRGLITCDEEVVAASTMAPSVEAAEEEPPAVYDAYRIPEPVPHGWLESYADCGLKFLYHYVYRLDDGENQFRVFSKAVRQIMKRIAESVAQGSLLSDEQIRDDFISLWEKATGERDESSLYIARGVQALLAFRGRLQAGEEVVIGHEASFFVDGRRVSLRIDELRHDGSRWEVRRHHLSKPSMRHSKDKFFLALQLANQGMNLRAPRMMLDYPLERKVEFVPLPYGDRVAGYKNQLAAALEAIESGHFKPDPSGFKCRNCAYYLICSAS